MEETSRRQRRMEASSEGGQGPEGAVTLQMDGFLILPYSSNKCCYNISNFFFLFKAPLPPVLIRAHTRNSPYSGINMLLGRQLTHVNADVTQHYTPRLSSYITQNTNRLHQTSVNLISGSIVRTIRGTATHSITKQVGFLVRQQNSEKRLFASSCLSVCLSVSQSARNNSALSEGIFMKFDISAFFKNLSGKFKNV